MKNKAAALSKVVLLLSLWPLAASAAEAPKAAQKAVVQPKAASAPASPAAKPAVPLVPAAEARASTASARPPKVEDFYTGAKKRSPYKDLGGAGPSASAPKELVVDELDMNQFIQHLSLTGLVQGRKGSRALLTDPVSNNGLVLRGGRLYDQKNNLIKGVRGEIDMARKTVKLTSPDKEFRVIRLGGEEGSDEDSGQTKKD